MFLPHTDGPSRKEALVELIVGEVGERQKTERNRIFYLETGSVSQAWYLHVVFPHKSKASYQLLLFRSDVH